MPSSRPAARPLKSFLRLAAVLVVLLAMAPADLHAAPYLFPATPDGQPAQVRDERDVAPFLAAGKAAALHRTRMLATPATANQRSYDVHYYDLDLTPDPTTQVLTGTVRMKASVVQGPLSTVELDLYANLTVDHVTSGGTATTWSRSGNVLTVNLDRAYAAGEWMDVVVSYHGAPSAAGYFGFDTANGRSLIWSLSEAYGARTWWPCKDAPEDKADSVDIRVTVPSGTITASNGTRIEATDDGTVAVTRWRERYPIATYLVSLTSYPYTVTADHYRYSPTDSMPIQFFNFPESVDGAATVQARVKDMIATYAGLFGEYPFVAEKYGHAQSLYGGGMEHQTCSSLPIFNETIEAHELAHQWWGDLVTCRDFHHIWLNEGFATYCEALWAEAIGGAAAYHAELSFNRWFGPRTIYVPDVSIESRIWDPWLSYNKGSWVLHMLRHVLGDTAFFAALRHFYVQYAYSTATTEDFRDVCEAVSGRDLDAFFQQWIYGEYYPRYRFDWTSAPVGGGHDVALTLRQIQSWQLFRMPIDVTVTTAGGERTFVVEDSLASQGFTLHVDAAPTAVAVDPDGWILKALELPVIDPALDRGVLLVNGLDWGTYPMEVTSAYADRAFWGDYSIDFWDSFGTPAGGYPVTLPEPLGHGAVPPEVLGRYRNVIWVSNDYLGDLASWVNTPIHSYLKSGGNVLLMTMMGQDFLDDSLRTYLGIKFNLASGMTLYDCIATRPGLTDIARLGAQTYCAVFDTVRTRTDTQLLYKVVSNYTTNRGIGVIRQPVEGGAHRADGGRFIFLSGRPYRWNHDQLKTNVMYMLQHHFGECVTPVAVEGPSVPPARLELAPARPNPFSVSTVLRFALPRPGPVQVEVLDPQGRRLRRLFAGPLGAGPHDVTWDGRDERGDAVAMGIYWVRIETASEAATRKVVRMR